MIEMRIDDAAVRWAVDGIDASADEAVAALASRPLLLLMHGFGSFEGDLIGLKSQLPTGFVCASPRAPLEAPPPIENGYSWWPLEIDHTGTVRSGPAPDEFAGSGPHAAALTVLNWLDDLDRRVSGGLSSIAIMGFSQGGCLVTSLLRLQPRRFACGVNCSGFVAPGAFAGDAELAAVRPPLFWGTDPVDPVIGTTRIEQTLDWAPEHTDLEVRVYPGIGHSISMDEVADIGSFLGRHVPGAISQHAAGDADGAATASAEATDEGTAEAPAEQGDS